MSSRQEIQLVSEYRQFSRQFCDENVGEIEKMQKFHRHLSKRPDFSSFLEQSLDEGCQSAKSQEILICAGYLAYLVNFQPDFGETLWEECELYTRVLVNGIYYSQQVKAVYVMLSSHEYFQFLKEITEKIEDLTSVSYVEGIEMNMSIIQKKLSWEVEMRKIARPRHNPRFQKFVDELVSFLCKKEHAKNEDLLSHIILMLHLVFEYLQKGISSYRERIIALVQTWMAQQIFKPEIKLHLFLVLKQCFDTFGLSGFKLPLCYQFFERNQAFVHKLEYLQLLSSFFSKFTKKMQVNQSQVNKILRELSKAIWRLPSVRSPTLYKQKSMMIDQIRKISSLFYWDLNKYITSDLKQVTNPSLYAFMTSLMFIFDQRMSSELVGKIEGEKRKYFESSLKNNEYEQILRQYCSEGVVEECLNPEMGDDLLWEFLTVRATVTINYNALCEIKRVEQLVVNLIKFVVLGVFPEQCIEIIEKVIANDPLYDLRQLETVSYSKLLEEVLPVLGREAFASQAATYERVLRMLLHLERVMVLLTSKYRLVEMKGLSIFTAILSFANRLPDCFISSALMRNQSRLLFAALPLDFARVSKEELSDCVAELLVNLRRTVSVADFELYLQIMARAAPWPQLRELFLESHEEVAHCILSEHLLDLAENLEDIYKINFYILEGRPFDHDILVNCWSILREIDSFHYTEFYSCILRLFEHFLVCLRSEGGDELKFIEFQVENIEPLLVRIDELIGRTITLKKVQQLLGAKISVLLYLHSLLQTHYQHTSFQSTQIGKAHTYLLKCYNDMKKCREYLTFPSAFKIKEYWCNIQMIILLMIPDITRRSNHRNPHALLEGMHELDERFEWLRRYYDRSEEGAIQTVSLNISSDLLELQEIAADTLRRN